MDWIDDFDEFENGDSSESEFDEDLELSDSFAGDTEQDDEPNQDESNHDNFTAKDAFILGGAMGYAYGKGLRERKREKRKKFSDESE